VDVTGTGQHTGGAVWMWLVQGSIQAVRSNWRWMSQLLKCTDVHLQNAADYHQVR